MRPEFIFRIIFILLNINTTFSEGKSRSLSRHKRYVVFPEGSSLTVAYCITTNLIEAPTAFFAEVINFGINYNLPNRTLYQLLKTGAEPKEKARRRYRRDLYNKVEIILNAMGFDGKTCVYKALCEVVQMLEDRGDNMLEEIIRRLFSFPLEKLHYMEPDDHKNYHWAHTVGHERKNCSEIFPSCYVSLLELLLGYKRFINFQ